MNKEADGEAAVRRTIAAIGPLDEGAMAAARARHAQLTKPPGSLGRLEALAIQIAGITGNPLPEPFRRKAIVVCAGDHGVTAEGVSAYPAAVTPQMVFNFVRGGAAINVLARQAGAQVVVADLGVDYDFSPHVPIVHAKIRRGTANMAAGPAMSRAEAGRAVAAGIELVERLSNGADDGAFGRLEASSTNDERGLITQEDKSVNRQEPALSAVEGSFVDLIGTGDMGIGNTTASSAIVAALTGAPVREVTGRGTGIDAATWERKVAVIERALAVNAPDPRDPLDVLAKVGGYEIGGIAGVVLGAAARRVPIVLDGFISGAAALVACGLCPQARDYLIPAHASVEVGHRIVLTHLGLRPLLDLDLRLGEGTGGAIAMHLIDDALAILREMATFAEAGVATATEREPTSAGGL